MKQSKVKPVRLMCEIAIMATLGFIFDELSSVIFRGVFINGGSISIAMLAVLVMAYRRGFIPGLITGLVMGLLDLATGPSMIAAGAWQVFAQVLLDYVIAYPLVSFAGLFFGAFNKAGSKKEKCIWIIVGTLLGGNLKLLSHFLSGILFWADPSSFAWPLDPLPYCFLYNFAYVGPSIVLSGALACLLYLKAPQIFDTPENALSAKEKKQRSFNVNILYLVTAIVGLGLTIFFAVEYGLSYSYDTWDGGAEVSFDKNYFGLMILSILTIIVSLVSFFSKKERLDFYLFGMSAIMLGCFVFDLARLIKAYMKEDEVGIYWIWFAVSLAIFLVYFTFFLLECKNKKQEAKAVVKEN